MYILVKIEVRSRRSMIRNDTTVMQKYWEYICFSVELHKYTHTLYTYY